MANILLAVFSQSGSTQAVADRIEIQLKSSGHKTEMIHIARDPIPDLSLYDAIGIGTPTFFLKLPFLVSDFIKSLPDLKGMHAFWFYTYGTVPGNISQELHKRLEAKAAIVHEGFSCYGADLWYAYIKRGYFFSPESPNKDELETAEHYGIMISGALKNNEAAAPCPDKGTPFILALERFLMNRFFIKSFYSHTFHSKKSLCNSCKQCVSNCPTQNIAFKNGRPKWKSDCIMCLHCALSCPEAAISSVIDWPLFAPFMNYNIKENKKRGRIPFVQVELKNGQIMKL